MSQANKVLNEKRQSLKKHLPFVNTMIEKMQQMKNSELEAKWTKMSNVISSDTQPLSLEQVNKLHSTITNLKQQFASKTLVKHQPIVTIKTEVCEQNSSDSNLKSTEPNVLIPKEKTNKSHEEVHESTMQKPQLSVLTSSPTTRSSQVILNIKKEMLSPCRKPLKESQIETDPCESQEDSQENDQLEQNKKSSGRKQVQKSPRQRNLSRKRILLSETSSDSESVTKEHQGLKKKPLKKRKITRLKSYSSDEIKNENSTVNDEDIMVSSPKGLINGVTNSETLNPKEVLEKLKSIIGERPFSTLQSLFLEESTGTKSEGISNKKSAEVTRKNRRGGKKKNEAEVLQEDIMNMFIRDGVLSAKGLRNCKKITYDEDSALQVMQELEIDPGSNEQSSAEDDQKYRRSSRQFTSRAGSSLSEFVISSTTSDQSPPLSESTSDEELQPKPVKLVECSVRLEKLDFNTCKATVKLFEDGSFKSLLQDETPSIIQSSDSQQSNLLVEINEVSSSVTPKEEINVYQNSNKKKSKGTEKPIQSSVLSCSETVDVDNEDVAMKTAKSTALAKVKVKSKPPKELPAEPVKSSILEQMENKNTVINLSYVKCRRGIRLKCNCENCDFESFDESLFQYHIQSKHIMFKWIGSCQMCKANISYFGTLLDEYNHMNNVHIKDNPIAFSTDDEQPKKKKRRRSDVTKSLKGSPVKSSETTSTAVPEQINKTSSESTSQADQVKEVSNQSSPKPVTNDKNAVSKAISNAANETNERASPSEDQANRLVLKIRCLPGDKLSSKLQVVPNTTTLMSKKLKPWLKKEFDFKKPDRINSMLTLEKLSDKFKCMGSDCDFTSNVPKTFLFHMKTHIETNRTDILNFNRCSYCSFVSSVPDRLVEHIVNEHKFDKYSCSRCFYRSTVQYFVVKHQETFHEDLSGKIIDTGSTIKPVFKDAINEAKSLREANIPSILCVVCKKKFYVHECYEKHFNDEHSHLPPSRQRCNKCQEETDKTTLRGHLENCHMVRRYHCIYCRYGENDFNDLRDHMMNSHPNKIPFFCERVAEKKTDPSSIDSISLKVIGDIKIYQN